MTDEERKLDDREKRGEAEPPVDEEERYHCRICDKYLKKKLNAVEFHARTRQHKRKLKAYKDKYRLYIHKIRRSVLKASRPKNALYRRLLFYKLLINYS